MTEDVSRTGEDGAPLTVGALLHRLLDLAVTRYGDHPTADAVVQVEGADETWFGVVGVEDTGEGGIVLVVEPLA